MFQFWLTLLERVVAEVLRILGATWQAIAIAIGIFVLVHLVKFLRLGLAEMKKHWAANIRDGVLVTFAVWLVLFIWAAGKIIYEDHQELTNSREMNQQLRTSNGQLIKERDQLQKDKDQLQAKLKEQPKVVYKDQPSKGPVARTPPTINSLFVEAMAVCSLRDPLKLPLTIGSQFPPGMGAFFEGPTGKAYLRNLYPVMFQRMEERDKAFTVLQFDLTNNSDLTGKPVSTLSRYDRLQINLWAIDYNAFTQCGFVELTLRMNGTDILREEIRNLPPTKQDAYYQILIPVKKIQLPQ
jgi:hypothetical protein